MKNTLRTFLLKLMQIDSTTGRECQMVDYLRTKHKLPGATIKVQHINANQHNLLFLWGKPKIVFCTHLDTVPPYFAPHHKNGKIYGRGACDAKGQIAAMYETCRQLYQAGEKNFCLLLLADEEQSSRGAKIANRLLGSCKYLILGEPTQNKLICASKGNVLVEVNIKGKAAHSGYPEYGKSAVTLFQDLLSKLSHLQLPHDTLLGATNYNIGQLHATNVCNVIPASVTCQIIFRTTFATHKKLPQMLQKLAIRNIHLNIKQQSSPLEFFTVPGFKTSTAAFGSDAPYLTRPQKILLYGPGNILHAHTDREQIKLAEIQYAIGNLKKLYYKLRGYKLC